MYKKMVQDTETLIQETNNNRSLSTIQDLMLQIKEIEEDIAKLQQQITGLLAKRSDPIDDEDL